MTWQTLLKPINHHKNRFPFLEGQNPTSCGLISMIHSPKPSQNSSRIVINLCFGPKWGFLTKISDIEMTISIHGDSVWSTLPSGTTSVGFEQEIGGNIISFMLSETNIVRILDFLTPAGAPLQGVVEEFVYNLVHVFAIFRWSIFGLWQISMDFSKTREKIQNRLDQFL